jgi:hypothetical protein
MRSEVPIAVSFIVGFLLVGDFFLNIKPLQDFAKEIQNWGIIVAAFALGLASFNLLRIHGNHIIRKNDSWPYSAALIVTLVGMAGLGVAQSANHPTYKFWFDNLFSPCQATVYAMTGFYISSAAYRAFRIRTVEASVLLISAAIVMLGRAPVGELMFKGFPDWANWLVNVVNMAGQRGMMIGAGIGAIASGLRVLLGIERGHMGVGSSG